MSTRESVETPIGFADGKVVRTEKQGTKVLVTVQAWDETTLYIEFDQVIGFRESMAFGLSDLVVTASKGEFLNWCNRRAYEGASGGETVYQFLDIEGEPCIEIVAKSVLIRPKGNTVL